MEQRRLRPGDRLDDYCPRERRVTDHVIVAVVDDGVKQTRCVACDTEHPFKEGRLPPRRQKKDAPAALVQRVLEDLGVEEVSDNGHDTAQPSLVTRPERKPAKGRRAASPAPPVVPPAAPLPAPPAPIVGAAEGDENDEGPVHRRLIRATLPRPEGQPPARPLPDFTIRQPGSRSGFGRGTPHAGRPGPKADRGSWNARPDGHGNYRSGVSGHGAEARGRHKPGRARGARPPQKKAR
jgi:hypothetical protein